MSMYQNHICIIYLNLGPYHVARLKALARVCQRLTVIEVAKAHQSYPWHRNTEEFEFELITLFDSEFTAVSAKEQCQKMRLVLDGLAPDAVAVSRYSEPVIRTAMRWAGKKKRALLLLMASTERDHRRKWWKEKIKSIYLKHYIDAVAAAGQRSVDYALKIGFDRQQIFKTGNVVDNDFFEVEATNAMARQQELRHAYNLPQHYILYVGRLIEKKNLKRLLNAFERHCQNRSGQHLQCKLVVVGNGGKKEELQKHIPGHMQEMILFRDWLDGQELVIHYALALCLVLPSTSEQWGLVVNEAMACGLPVVVSEVCGCVPELCSGTHAKLIDPLSEDSLLQALDWITDKERDLTAMGEASRRIVGNYSTKRWSQALLNGFKYMENKK